RAPHLPLRRPPIHELPQPELVAALRGYGAVPAEVFDHEDLVELYARILRADFALHDTYVHRPGPPLAAPLSVFGGREDPYVPLEDLEPWAQHTAADLRLEMFPGGHFFLKDSRAQLLDQLARELVECLA